jgi:hypothetical protein
MSKPTMGRGLGDLLTETKSQGDNQNQNGKTQIAAGVRTLMQGAGPAVAPAPAAKVAAAPATKVSPAPVPANRIPAVPTVAPKTSAPTIQNPKGPAIPLWYFLAADAVLIGLALLIAFKSPKPMPTSRMILAIVITVLAAGCGLCALLAGSEKD